SVVNGQPWFVHAVSQAETMKKVITACTGLGMNRFIHQAQAFFVVTETRDKLISTTISKIKKLDFQTIDIGIFIAYLSLAATSQGLGSCILGWFNEKQLQEALNLPKSEKVRIVIALGYPESDEVKPKKRKSLNQISKFH
ncbi:MAG TPA: nitroreductase family protein, partial [Bacilli bacterium]|nr:nitroreductase family protein [Bacilli bacterium]